VDYYGYKEYQGRDAYGYFHQPKSQDLDTVHQVKFTGSNKNVYYNPYSICKNTDYQTSDNYTPYRPVCQELNSKPICKPEHNELHFYKNIDHTLVSKHKVFELNADYYEDTISTSLDSTNFNKRLEFIRNFKASQNLPKVGVLSNISLGVKAVKDDIVFIYIKCQDIGRRKIL
jgi:hypothetical protein